MKNKYDGKCIFCGCKVPRKQGICWQHKVKGWIVSCSNCSKTSNDLNKKLDKMKS